MINWIKFLFQVCFLKAAPQDAPSSRTALYLSVTLYFFVGLFITLHTQAWIQSFVTASVQTGLIIFVTNLILWIRKTPERFTQTLTALMGAGALIGIIAIPVLNLISGTGGPESAASVLWIALILWETLVIGHILRHTLDLSLFAGLGMALVYMYLSFTITVRILKVMSYSVG